MIQLVAILLFVFFPAAEVLFFGSKPTDQKLVLFHLAHAGDYFVWNTALLSWFIYGVRNQGSKAKKNV